MGKCKDGTDHKKFLCELLYNRTYNTYIKILPSCQELLHAKASSPALSPYRIMKSAKEGAHIANWSARMGFSMGKIRKSNGWGLSLWWFNLRSYFKKLCKVTSDRCQLFETENDCTYKTKKARSLWKRGLVSAFQWISDKLDRQTCTHTLNPLLDEDEACCVSLHFVSSDCTFWWTNSATTRVTAEKGGST